jgi:hypothetical protein
MFSESDLGPHHHLTVSNRGNVRMCVVCIFYGTCDVRRRMPRRHVSLVNSLVLALIQFMLLYSASYFIGSASCQRSRCLVGSSGVQQ